MTACRDFRSSILVWIWPSLISRVADTKTVLLTISICFHLSYATNCMTIYLFDHARLATGDRFCCFFWRVSACCLYSETSLRVIFAVSRGDAGQRAKDINGQKGMQDYICQKQGWGRRRNGLNMLVCVWVMKSWWT
jgi:hypothetical protein